MLQLSEPLPADIPACGEGHHPRMITTRGAPAAVRAYSGLSDIVHIECTACGLATRPCFSRTIAELRWTNDDPRQRIPLTRLARAREQAYRDAVIEHQRAA